MKKLNGKTIKSVKIARDKSMPKGYGAANYITFHFTDGSRMNIEIEYNRYNGGTFKHPNTTLVYG